VASTSGQLEFRQSRERNRKSLWIEAADGELT
jgi:hypothetical protein